MPFSPSVLAMTMIRPYLPDDLSRILDLYNSLVVGRVPHCWSVMSSSLDETLQAGLVTPSSLDETLETGEAEPRLLEQAVLVADSGGDGFVHVGRQATNKWQEDEIGVIRFLAYRRGERAVGDALLAAAESWMRERDLRRSVVMPQPWRYPFYAFPHAYLSDHLDHVQALLRFRGYAKIGGEVFLDWLDMQPKLVGDSSGLDYELRVEDCPGAGSDRDCDSGPFRTATASASANWSAVPNPPLPTRPTTSRSASGSAWKRSIRAAASDASCWHMPCTWRESAAIATVPSAPLLTTTAPSCSTPTTVFGSSIGPTNLRESSRDLRPRLPRYCP